MTRRQVLEKLASAWNDFTESYAGLPQADLVKPGVIRAWSVRDIIAHVTTWEEEALKHLPSILEGGTPPRYSTSYGGIDAFNAQMTVRKAALSLSEVLDQQERVHEQVIALVERVPEDLFLRESRFRRRLRLDTYSHYPKHAKAIRLWRKDGGA
jgi:hypothetical protein